MVKCADQRPERYAYEYVNCAAICAAGRRFGEIQIDGELINQKFDLAEQVVVSSFPFRVWARCEAQFGHFLSC